MSLVDTLIDNVKFERWGMSFVQYCDNDLKDQLE
jgi:hypothetical protein